MSIASFDVNGLVGLVHAVNELDLNNTPGRLFWFRGLRCHGYQLKPKIYRDEKTSDQVFEREARLLTRFRQRSQAYWREGYPQTDWEHLFAMQHYGLPTRLLDWSENLLVAAYFASGLDEGHAHESDCGSVIWCVDPVQWNRATPVLTEFGEQIHVLNTVEDELDAYAPFSSRKRQRSPVAMYGSHNTGRILAQRGTFMVWGNEDISLDQLADQNQQLVLRKFNVLGGKKELALSLKRMGFTETMFFPDLVALASELTGMEGWK